MATLSGLTSGGSATTQEEFANSLISKSLMAKKKTLHAYTTNTNNYSTPRELGASSGYQVPSGKKFIVTHVRHVEYSGSAGNKIAIVSATTDVGLQSSSAPGTYDFSSPGFGNFGNFALSTAAYEVIDKTWIYVVPAGRYLTVSSPTNNAFTMITGFEVDQDATSL